MRGCWKGEGRFAGLGVALTNSEFLSLTRSKELAERQDAEAIIEKRNSPPPAGHKKALGRAGPTPLFGREGSLRAYTECKIRPLVVREGDWMSF